MSARYPTDPDSLISFPTDRKLACEIFGCSSCQKMLNPDHYFICEEKGHQVCSHCAKSPDPQISFEDVVLMLSQPKSSSLEETCCAPGTGNLKKGPPYLLDTLFKSCEWECKYKYRGCTEFVLGKDWASHIRQCRYYRIMQCPFYGCGDQVLSIRKAQAVEHILKKHDAQTFDGPTTTLIIPFDVLIQAHRMLALIKWDDGYYLFSCEIDGNSIYMWIWNMQAFDDSSDEQDVTCTIKLDSEGVMARNDFNFRVCFVGHCLPHNLTASDVISKENCMGVPLDNFKKQYVKLDERGIRTFTVTALLETKNKPQL